jgi:hypothetical protein
MQVPSLKPAPGNALGFGIEHELFFDLVGHFKSSLVHSAADDAEPESTPFGRDSRISLSR